MDYSELLHDFLDGELNPVHEDTLFSALQTNESLRLEMKDLLEMRRAVEADKVAFMPSATSTNAIFSQLGFAAPAAAGAGALAGTGGALAASTSGGAVAGAGFGLAQVFGVVAGAALLTSLVFIGLVIPGLDNSNNDSALERSAHSLTLEDASLAGPLDFTMLNPAEPADVRLAAQAAGDIQQDQREQLIAAADAMVAAQNQRNSLAVQLLAVNNRAENATAKTLPSNQNGTLALNDANADGNTPIVESEHLESTAPLTSLAALLPPANTQGNAIERDPAAKPQFDRTCH